MGLFTRGSSWGVFRDAYLNADPQQLQQGVYGDFDTYSRWEARQVRYDLYWGAWQGNHYRDQAHIWAVSFKHDYGIYKHTRPIFNPIRRLVEFHVTHLLGGPLDPKAGRGEESRSAAPIDTDNEQLRPAIAKLWKDSRFSRLKSLWTRYGACLGDAPMFVDDDPERGRVSLRVIHPGHLKWVDRDTAGNVRSYIIERMRYDPRAPKVKDLNPMVDPRGTHAMVKYQEEAFVEKGQVTFRTFLNGAPFNWRGFTEDGAELPAEWQAPYPFIPLVLPQHIEIGLQWGVAEPHGFLAKMAEIDDAASIHNDGIRKRMMAPKMLSGIKAPSGPPFDSRRDAHPDWNANERNEAKFLYAQQGAAVHDLTNDLNSAGVNQTVELLIAELERDFPELQMDVWSTGDPSGRALRVARQRTESKIQERRTAYDEALVQAHRFAFAIGATQGYEGYAGLPTDPFEDGQLDHSICHRPVFSPDPLDDIEEGNAFWTMVGAAVKAGMPLEEVLRREGWPEEDIGRVMATKAANAAEAMAAQRQTNATTMQMPAGDTNGQPVEKVS